MNFDARCSPFWICSAAAAPRSHAKACVQDWMEGHDVPKPWFLKGRDALVWSRQYSHTDSTKCNCDLLQQTLEELGGSRMVVGHTIQPDGVNAACDNQVLRCARHVSAELGTAPV